MEDNKMEMPDYNSECDANTLISAAEIRMDPERMAEALKEINKQKKVISSIDDIKAKSAEMDDQDEEDAEGDDGEESDED